MSTIAFTFEDLCSDCTIIDRMTYLIKFIQIANNQIKIYSTLGLSTWADAITVGLPALAERILANLDSIKAKEAAGMIPVFMPGRDVQRAEWEESFKLLKPINRIKGNLKEVGCALYFTQEQLDLCEWDTVCVLDISKAWEPLNSLSYVFWTKPSEVNPETKDKSVEEQKKLIAQKHKDNPELYDERDLHPLEYAALQVMHTHELLKISIESEDIIPFDYIERQSNYSLPTGFISLPLSTYTFLMGEFNGEKMRYSMEDAKSHGFYGIRLVSRL